ncbi:hypothetical protein [Sphingobacterium tabacisoli]|uniref:DUF5671 domain-containing protein n=1 Tax=Sphingobacterium tabacisoli TaxID=2044855 RepID=A0ABW5L895_9SPHI|nr:hypothetical protein [Sphingobacterium tabacisoli]
MAKFTIRSILGNLFVTYIFFPLFYIRSYWGNLINQNYQGAYFQSDSVYAYLDRIFNGFFLFSNLFLLGSLLPYHLIKYYKLYKIQDRYYFSSLMAYISINVLLVLITGYGGLFLSDIGGGDHNIPFLVTLVAFSAITHGLLYLFVDRYRTEKTDKKSSIVR